MRAAFFMINSPFLTIAYRSLPGAGPKPARTGKFKELDLLCREDG
jgi:hypothetical protein